MCFLHDVQDWFATSDDNTAQCTITVERPSPASSSRTPSTGKSEHPSHTENFGIQKLLSVADILRDVDG